MNQNPIKKRAADNQSTVHTWLARYKTKLGKKQLLYALSAFVFCSLTLLLTRLLPAVSRNSGIEAGKVADRDIIANEDIVYIDQEATSLQISLEKSKIAPIFILDDKATQKTLQRFEKFKNQALDLIRKKTPQSELLSALQKQFGTEVNQTLMQKLISYPAPQVALAEAERILERVLGRGIVAFPDTGLENFNPQTIEIQYWKNGSLNYEQVSIDNAITLMTSEKAVQDAIKTSGLTSSAMNGIISGLALAYLQENTFFDADKSNKRLESISSMTEPVLRQISRGEKIIRKGFIITEQDIEQYRALQTRSIQFNIPLILGNSLLIAIFFFGILILLKGTSAGTELSDMYWLFTLGAASLYFLLVNILFAVMPQATHTLIPVLLPGTLLIMTITILINERFSLMYSIFLSVLYLVASNFDGIGSVAVLLSGFISANFAMRTEQRIDLIKSSLQIGGYQFILGVVLTLIRENNIASIFLSGLWFAVNGFLCGTLTLGFLPILEHWFNAPTIFRLQELSDLNNPLLKRLSFTAPGTYTHSLTVAHLAESACLAIGASPILARVGAYYHDIGKMEQPEYFIENQSGYNKHSEIGPGLSVTIIKSHVQFGVERARELGLPQIIVDIIAQHHGTSIIHYFYAEMKKENPNLEPTMFRYPGPLPQTREAAMVMLADSVEAASRSLKKPTLQKLETMIDGIIKGKMQDDQLSGCNLTFRDIEQITSAFAHILAAQFHSRIEYPKLMETRHE